MIDRVTAAIVERRNGAWMISWFGEVVKDHPYHEWFDCASSLREAKKLAREGATDFGYTNLRWSEDRKIGWVLEGVEVENTEEY
jgi:hypothetical protein